MTRVCSGCGQHSCDGRCFDEPDPRKVEFWANFDELRKRVADAERIAAERKAERKVA